MLPLPMVAAKYILNIFQVSAPETLQSSDRNRETRNMPTRVNRQLCTNRSINCITQLFMLANTTQDDSTLLAVMSPFQLFPVMGEAY